MAQTRFSLSLFAAMFVISSGLLLTGCGEEGAPAEEGTTMDDAADQIKDGIDPETGNPPEL